MSDTQGWYARRLGQVSSPVSAPAPRPQYPQQPQQQVYQNPQPLYQQPQQTFQSQQPQTQAVEFAGHVYTGVENYQGGIGQQMNPDPCPQCGGNQYFARLKTKGRGPEPAGHCFNCGYNELFDQGDSASWGSNVVQGGQPVQMADIQVSSSPFQ